MRRRRCSRVPTRCRQTSPSAQLARVQTPLMTSSKGVLFVAVAQRRNSSAVARASCLKSVALPSALPACVALRWTAVTSLTVLLVYTGSVATLPSRYSLERNDFMSPLVPPTTRREARRIRNCIFQKMTTGRVHCNSRRLFCFHFRGITPSNGLFGTLPKEFLWVFGKQTHFEDTASAPRAR